MRLHELVCAFQNGNLDTIANMPLFGVFYESFVREVIKSIFENAIAKYPEKVHPCPLQRDDLQFFNYSSNDKIDFEKIQPDGDYRYEHKFWSDGDENILRFFNIIQRMNFGWAS